MLQLHMSKSITIGISSCLLGKKTRYDGDHRRDDHLLKAFGRYVKWVPVCPEVECGLPIPREPMKLVGNINYPSLVTKKTKIDHTERMKKYVNRKLKALEKEDLDGFIFKSRSPSCGIRKVRVSDRSGSYCMGRGIFTDDFVRSFQNTPVEDEQRFHNRNNLHNFIERVVLLYKWKEFIKNKSSIISLVSFHSDHKLTIMAHNPTYLRELDRMISNANKYKPKKLHYKYLNTLMEGMRLKTTVKKNIKVLQLLTRYFNKLSPDDEIKELLEVIEHYHKGIVPLIVPVALLNHYVRKFKVRHLSRQHFLNPHPIELMHRNQT